MSDTSQQVMKDTSQQVMKNTTTKRGRKVNQEEFRQQALLFQNFLKTGGDAVEVNTQWGNSVFQRWATLRKEHFEVLEDVFQTTEKKAFSRAISQKGLKRQCLAASTAVGCAATGTLGATAHGAAAESAREAPAVTIAPTATDAASICAVAANTNPIVHSVSIQPPTCNGFVPAKTNPRDFENDIRNALGNPAKFDSKEPTIKKLKAYSNFWEEWTAAGNNQASLVNTLHRMNKK